MQFDIGRRRRIACGLGIAAVTAGIGGLGASPAAAATRNPTAVRVVCPANIHVGVAAKCGISVSDIGSPSKGAPTGTVTLQTNQAANAGTFTTPSSTGNPAVCTLVPTADGRTSRCTFTYTATTNTGATRVFANYGGDAGHQAGFGFTDLVVNP